MVFVSTERFYETHQRALSYPIALQTEEKQLSQLCPQTPDGRKTKPAVR